MTMPERTTDSYGRPLPAGALTGADWWAGWNVRLPDSVKRMEHEGDCSDNMGRLGQIAFACTLEAGHKPPHQAGTSRSSIIAEWDIPSTSTTGDHTMTVLGHSRGVAFANPTTVQVWHYGAPTPTEVAGVVAWHVVKAGALRLTGADGKASASWAQQDIRALVVISDNRQTADTIYQDGDLDKPWPQLMSRPPLVSPMRSTLPYGGTGVDWADYPTDDELIGRWDEIGDTIGNVGFVETLAGWCAQHPRKAAELIAYGRVRS